MKFLLDYGRTGLEVDLPGDRVVGPLAIRNAEPLSDPAKSLQDSLENPIGTRPLAELARGRKDACILICDITRPVPNSLILGGILGCLENAGIPREKILILVATGLHRPNEGPELEELVGSFVYQNYRIENHRGKNREEHTFLGTTERGVPIWIDTRYVQADLKITTGLIEPHLMAGFSGGRKVICPGIAGLETVKVWHSPRFIEDPPGRLWYPAWKSSPRRKHFDRQKSRLRFYRQCLHRWPKTGDLAWRGRHDQSMD